MFSLFSEIHSARFLHSFVKIVCLSLFFFFKSSVNSINYYDFMIPLSVVPTPNYIHAMVLWNCISISLNFSPEWSVVNRLFSQLYQFFFFKHLIYICRYLLWIHSIMRHLNKRIIILDLRFWILDHLHVWRQWNKAFIQNRSRYAYRISSHSTNSYTIESMQVGTNKWMVNG